MFEGAKTIEFPKYDNLPKPIKVIEIPEGATNGDVIKAMFPDKELWQTITSIYLATFDHNYAEIYKSSWWNSPYRKEQE